MSSPVHHSYREALSGSDHHPLEDAGVLSGCYLFLGKLRPDPRISAPHSSITNWQPRSRSRTHRTNLGWGGGRHYRCPHSWRMNHARKDRVI